MFNYSQIDSSIEKWMLDEVLTHITTHLSDFEVSAPALKCMDGFSMSCQANSMTYCTPRKSGLLEYEEAEVGFPSSYEVLLGNNEDSVYGQVSIDVIKEIVQKHGGLDCKKTFKDFPKIVSYLEEKERNLKEREMLIKDKTFLKPLKVGKKKI